MTTTFQSTVSSLSPSQSPSKKLAALFDSRGGLANLSYLTKGSKGKESKALEHFNEHGSAEGGVLIMHLVHEELGTSLEVSDFRGLGQTADEAVTLSEDYAAKSYSASVSLEIPGPSSEGIGEVELKRRGSCEVKLRRRAETLTFDRQWSYPDGWPTPLEPTYFDYPAESLPPLVLYLRRQALVQRKQRKRLILTRSADEVVRSGTLEFVER